MMQTRTQTTCTEIEPDLVAAATGDADGAAEHRVQGHVAVCAPCAAEYQRYRTIDRTVGVWRHAGAPASGLERARKRLQSSLDDLRHRIFTYRVFDSPLGHILIALSDKGVSLIEYLGRNRTLTHSRLSRMPGVEPIEDGSETEGIYRELLEYLEGKRTHLEWPLDFRLVRSKFHRNVLQTTTSIPYGAVMSYAGLACEIGRPAATRAVAQALRWNPLPIVIPCHRVVGTSGSLTGYAGDKIDLKQRLLAAEGIRTRRAEHDFKVSREAMYVGHYEGREYCLPSCRWVAKVKHPYRFRFFSSGDRAEAAGFAPCTDCRPDLHPLPR